MAWRGNRKSVELMHNNDRGFSDWTTRSSTGASAGNMEPNYLRRRTTSVIQTVDHARAIAKKKFKAVWDFIDGGAGDEQAIAANRHSLNDVVFQPKYLVDVSKPDTSLTILVSVSHPLVLSPSGLATLAHPDGGIAVARAAQGAGAILSQYRVWNSIEEVGEQSQGRLWFQLF